jgi:hypothetical protein
MCSIVRLSWGAVVAAAASVAVLACPPDSSAAITLTGVNAFSTDNSGNWTGQIWDTRGNINTAYGLWMINGGFGGSFINGPDMAHAPINVSLPLGTSTFSFHGDPGSDSRWGMNLFFNGTTSSPGISVLAFEKTGSSTTVFSPNTTNSTPSFDGTPLAPVAGNSTRSPAAGGGRSAYQWVLLRPNGA